MSTQQTLNRTNFPGAQYPTKILQFGEGNFLRGFVDWQIDLLNEHTDLNAGIAIVRPIDSAQPASLNTQDGLYTTVIRGINEQGEAEAQLRTCRSVNEEIAVYQNTKRFFELATDPNIELIFSNTTEAGIAFDAADKLTDYPARTFPAKLTQWLLARYNHFNATEAGASEHGVTVIPCELIDYNGDQLSQYVFDYSELWQLDAGFADWLHTHCAFCSTLVDRIVTGHPREEHEALQQQAGYRDAFMLTAEYFYLFVIQGPKSLAQQLRLERYPLNIRLVDDIKPYKERKVAILNGAHTAMVPVAFLAGIDTVGDAMLDDDVRLFVERLLSNEVIPVLDLPHDELDAFAHSVKQRFQNPYIRHQLLSIALNSMTKFKTRLLPQLLANIEQQGSAPQYMSLALAAQLALYRGERDGEAISLSDDEKWMTLFPQLWQQVDENAISLDQLVDTVLADAAHWGQDLSQLAELSTDVTAHLRRIRSDGMRHALRHALGADA